ncbi:MAG: hypothetical protein GW855_03965 [Erythrobacter sp.]|nr:hypothetical protein [Erythrobacter sp.]NCQ64530.1 hypothetical protein [Alphaproteobacteria bacterium]
MAGAAATLAQARLALPRFAAGQSTLVGAALLAIVVLQAVLLVHKGINWDEYFHLTEIYRFRAGTLTHPLQTFWVRPLGWVPGIGGTSVDQILVIRLVMEAAALVTAAGIYAIARRFAGHVPALLCACAYLSAGYVFTQAFAYRADPLAAACLVWVMWIAGAERLSWFRIAVGAGLVALAGLFTIKSAFWAVPIGGYALYVLWPLARAQQIARIARLAVLAGAGAALFAIALALHGAGLPSDTAQASARGLSSAGTTVFSQGFFPQARFVLRQIGMGLPFAILAALAIRDWRSGDRSARSWVLLAGLYGLLLTLAVYRNAYPYFFVFLLPPVAIALAPLMAKVTARGSAPLYALIFAANAAILFMLDPADPLPNQRIVQEAVREVFPEPVTYIDFSGQISDYPRAVDFMTSGWGLAKYRARGVAEIQERARQEPIPLLLDNHWVLGAARTGKRAPEELLPQDARFIRRNFVHHWGPIFVAGKAIAPATQTIRIEIPGTYTLEGAAIRLDGRAIAVGDTLDLPRGAYRIDANEAALLRWGDNLPRPAMALPVGMMMSEY